LKKKLIIFIKINSEIAIKHNFVISIRFIPLTLQTLNTYGYCILDKILQVPYSICKIDALQKFDAAHNIFFKLLFSTKLVFRRASYASKK